MSQHRVSVVVPAYNAERYLREAVESALAQTVAAEVIVVDDGSTDGTAEVARSFGSRVRVLQQTNSRQAAARNAGARIAGGDYLAFLDADDVWEPDKLEKQLACLEADPTLGLVYCSVREMDERGALMGIRPARLRGRAYRELLLGEPWGGINGSTSLLPRRVFEEMGGFDTELPPCEDTDLFWRVAARYPIDFAEAPLVRYRVHPTSAHHDLPAMTRAWQRLYAKALVDPQVKALGRGFQRQCWARLHYMLAGEHANAGLWPQAVAHAVRALGARPSVVGRMLAHLWARWSPSKNSTGTAVR